MVYGDDGDNRCFRWRLFFVYNYLLSPHLTQCYGLLRTILFKLYVFRPYHFSFVVCPSVLDDLPPLVVVALSSSCPDLLRVFNYIVRVSKIATYLLRGEVHVGFSGSNVDDCFKGASSLLVVVVRESIKGVGVPYCIELALGPRP